ncbi:MAG: hypothetical protein Q4G63_03180 [Bacteroidia bacterium]|nr:hypothetical protein [Bacteroidia bacterium]
MYVNVKINTQTERGKQLIKQLKRYPKTVKFDNPAESEIVPEGYMTSDKFRVSVKRKINEYCDKHGIL